MANHPRTHVPPLALAEAGLSTGAVEYAGATAVWLEPDLVVSALPPRPPSKVIRAAIHEATRRPPPLLAGPVGAAAVLASSPAPRRRPHSAELATPHGVAAALKAEAPQLGPHWQRAAEAEARGFDGSADHHDRAADRRVHQRTARKAANRRRAKRGWR